MVEIAASGESAVEARVGHPHRPDEGVDLAYEHARAQEALQNMRNAYLDLLNAFLSVSAQRFGAEAYKTRPTLTTLACWVGYDLDGRTDIKWSHSFLIRLQEKRAALIEMRERFLVIRHRLGDSDKTLRLFRQITGKLDLAVAAVDEQVRALSNVGVSGASLSRAANVITRPDSYNITTTEPITALLDQLIDAVDSPQMKRSVASLAGLIEMTGLGTSHIHLRINAAQLNNAFRAFVHEPWTRDLTERQAMGRIVDMIRDVKPRNGQLRLAGARDRDRHPPARARRPDPEAHRPRHADPLPDRRVREPGDGADRGVLRQAVRRREDRRYFAAVRNPRRARHRRALRRASAGGGSLPRLRARARTSQRANRILGCRPLHRPDPRDTVDRAALQRPRRSHGARGPRRRRNADLLDPRRVDGPRRASRRHREPPATTCSRRSAPPLR